MKSFCGFRDVREGRGERVEWAVRNDWCAVEEVSVDPVAGDGSRGCAWVGVYERRGDEVRGWLIRWEAFENWDCVAERAVGERSFW